VSTSTKEVIQDLTSSPITAPGACCCKQQVSGSAADCLLPTQGDDGRAPEQPAFGAPESIASSTLQQGVKATASAKPQGEWSNLLPLPNVAIHAHMLHTGKVLFWGRRKQPTDNSFSSLNEWETHTFLFDLATGNCSPTLDQPINKDNKPINLFCSSHTFLHDGKLIVLGGHPYDSQGIDAATIYNPLANRWSASDPMRGLTKSDPANAWWRNGRWYPSAITLPDGGVMVCSGTAAVKTPAPHPNAPNTTNNSTPEIWDGSTWKQLIPFIEATDLQTFLFPRFHLAPDGRVFLAGPGSD
jgi:galactose oxidase